jgi:hypothetical protein
MSAPSARGAVRAALELLRRQLGKPALDEVQPGGACRREVQGESRVRSQPAFDHRRLVCRGVVEHEIDSEFGGDLAVECLQKLLELDRAMARVHGADHLAGREIQRGVQARGAVALVVVRGALGRAGQHRQDRCGPIQSLDLRLLVHARHDRALRRIQVEPDDVTDLLHEQRVLGQLSALLAVRMQAERAPDPRHRRL